MLNDLLIRDDSAGRLERRDFRRATAIRLVAPTNLRRREDYRMPAANVFSLAFLTRRASSTCRETNCWLRSAMKWRSSSATSEAFISKQA